MEILLVLAWYAPDGIPRSLLDGFGNKLTVRSAVGRLAAHSMIKVHRDTGTLSVHSLVQAVSRTKEAGDPHRSPEAVDRAGDRAATALVAGLPDDVHDPADWPVWRALLPHVEAMAALRPPEADSEDLARALTRAGGFAAEQGMSARARRLLLRAEAGLVRLVGPEHLSALSVRSRLIASGSVSVEEATRHADLCRRVLGARHPEAVNARYALAMAYRKANEIGQASEILAEVVRLRGDELGPDHRDTLRARADLASIQLNLGDVKGALDGLHHVHADCVRALGAQHPLTLTVRGRIGGMAGPGDVLTTLGPGLVRVLQERSAEGFRELLGRMLDALSPDEARAWAEEQLVLAEAHFADCEQVLGPGHTDTIAARLHLVALHCMAQDSAAAVGHAREAVAAASRHLGPEAPVLYMAQAMLIVLSLVESDAPVDGLGALGAQMQSLAERMQDQVQSLLPPPGGESPDVGSPDAP